MQTEIRKGFGTEIGKFMLLPVAPKVLHRIEFRSIGRQGLKIDPAILLPHKVLHQPAPMNGSTVPDDKNFAVDVAHQMGKEFNHLGTSECPDRAENKNSTMSLLP